MPLDQIFTYISTRLCYKCDKLDWYSEFCLVIAVSFLISDEVNQPKNVVFSLDAVSSLPP